MKQKMDKHSVQQNLAVNLNNKNSLISEFFYTLDINNNSVPFLISVSIITSLLLYT